MTKPGGEGLMTKPGGATASSPVSAAANMITMHPLLAAGLALAVLVSGGLIWAMSGAVLAAVAFAIGLAVLACCAIAAGRMVAGNRTDELAPPDWSVTVAAIEQTGVAIAITDRANRLTCANATYHDWFGHSAAPSNLPLMRPALEALGRATREAWRDGRAATGSLAATEADGEYRADAVRAGRGDDYLIWRFTKADKVDHASQMAQWITGPAGGLLSNAGIEAALVDPRGFMQAVSTGFAARASGDAEATLAGQEFVRQLRTDDQDRIFFALEGRTGPPQMLVQVPLSADGGAEADTISLMLLIESGLGIGAGEDRLGSAATSQLEALLGALPLGLAMTDRDGRFLFGNSAFMRAVGEDEGTLPQYPSDLVAKEDKGALADAVRRFAKGAANNADMAVRLRHQPDDPVSLGLAGVRGLGDAAVLLSLIDSTEETKLKRQVAQATKMQAVGQLAGGVAHDFNNVLTAIIGYCDLMLLRHTPGDSDYDDIQQIRANSNRAASLTRHLLAFSRQQTLRPEVLQLPDVVSEVSQLLKRLLDEKITFTVRHDRDLGPVRTDPQQLEQVIINLAVNARDAIHARGNGTGKLSLTTRRVSTEDVRRMESEIIPVGDYTVLTVQDNGGGIPPELLSKIYDPFFTTKEQGKGTGLGLSTVYGIVKQSGGFIFAENVQASGAASKNMIEGARFTLYLPVYQGEPVAKPAALLTKSASNWSGGGRILFVEDEDMVRAVGERALSRAGYTVVTASDGEEGLVAIANSGAFDMVVSDVVMPGMDGPKMVRALRKQHPEMPVLFMSGYAEEQLREEIDLNDMHFLPKPFSVQQIADTVSGILAAKA